MIDGLREEMHAAIAKEKLSTAPVSRLEADFGVPIARPMARIGRARIAGVEIDRDQRRAVTVAVIA